MASLTFTQILSLPRWHSSWPFYPSVSIVKVQNVVRSQNQWILRAAARKKVTESSAPNTPDENVLKKTPGKRGRKKAAAPVASDVDDELVSDVDDETAERAVSTAGKKGVKKTRGRPRLKAAAEIDVSEKDKVEKEAEEKIEKKERRGRKPKKKVDEVEDAGSEPELSDQVSMVQNVDSKADEERELVAGEEEDISHLYGWPPLVCCFGAAQHAFVPSGRPANRLIDHEIHEQMRDARWAPEKFIRAPGSSSGSVAIALASLGGKVEFMGKLGDDDYGQAMLWYMNSSNVRTRSVRIDSKRATAVSLMKISKRGGLRMTCAKPCAEDSLTKHEINIDVLKEAKMFYFNSMSLVEKNMRSTSLEAIKVSKKLGGVIFYDVNLPMPLWRSSEETKELIHQAWNLADIIEVTKQELEFLCGITPAETFDTKDNDRSKFAHYDREVVSQLWHENLKVMFVTNGTSKIHYYTKEDEGFVRGMEDPPLTPFTADMSSSGDGIVAALLRMLTVQPDMITDKGYLEHSIKYAIDCGVIDQWCHARIRGFPANDSDDEVEPDSDGIRSITETEYRTTDDPEELEVPDPSVVGITLLSEKVKEEEPEEDFQLVS
uniref:Carbohydrate kinase PfkB domain-containing protein n=1 Tax=Kalanchoe fedtschenkoi TaxID=63787 RepID=A0A7N0ZSB3_KALFE